MTNFATKLKYKKLVFNIFALFFVITTPFLIFFSLGYKINFGEQKLTNALTVRIETIPRSALILENNKQISDNTPTEFKYLSGNKFNLEIRKDGFLTENFLLYGPQGVNSAAPLFPFWLLPTEGNVLANFGDNAKNLNNLKNQKNNLNLLKREVFWTEEKKIENLSSNLNSSTSDTKDSVFNSISSSSSGEIKTEKTEKFELKQFVFIQNFSINGLRNEINDVQKLSNRKLENVQFEAVSENTYWDKKNNWLLLEKQNLWLLFDLESENFNDWQKQNFNQINLVKEIEKQIIENIFQSKNDEEIKANMVKKFQENLTNPTNSKTNPILSIIRSNSDQILVLDSKSNLWSWNLNTYQWEFLSSNIQGISFSQTPNNIWILKNNAIYRFSIGYLGQKSFLNTTNTKPFRKNNDLLNLNNLKKFVVKDFSQGLILQIDDKIWYAGDFDTENWKVFANNVLETAISEDNIFWLSKNGGLFSYNNYINQEIYLGEIKEVLKNINPEQDLKTEDISLHYDEAWKRLFIYNKKEVWALRIDKNLFNVSIVSFYPKKWIEGQCWSELIDRFQFCLSLDSKLEVYRNNHLW